MKKQLHVVLLFPTVLELCSTAGVPKLLDTRDWFHGRQPAHRRGVGTQVCLCGVGGKIGEIEGDTQALFLSSTPDVGEGVRLRQDRELQRAWLGKDS